MGTYMYTYKYIYICIFPFVSMALRFLDYRAHNLKIP